MKGIGNWMKGVLLVLLAAVMVLGFQTVEAYADVPASKPSNFKVTSNETTANFTWENPWGEDYNEAKNDDDVMVGQGGLMIEMSSDGGNTWKSIHTLSYLGGASNKIVQKAAYYDLEHGKTYSFRIFYYNGSSDDPQAGPKVNSSPASIKCETKAGTESDEKNASDQSIRDKFAAAGKVTSTSGYSADSDLKAGMKIVYDRGAYRLTVEVVKVAKAAQWDMDHYFYTLKYTLESKVGKKLTANIYTDKKDETEFWDNPEALTKTAEITSDCKAEIAPHTIRIQIQLNSPAIEKDEYLDFVTIPAPANLSGGQAIDFGAVPVADSTKSSIALTNLTAGDKEIQYRKKGSSSWKTVKTGGAGYTIKKLKANTVYEVRYRLSGSGKERNGKPAIFSGWSNTLSIRTAMKKAPKATLKASGAKYKKWKIAAHWERIGSKWYWRKESYAKSTSFKLKVNMKSSKGLAGVAVEINGVRQYITKKSGTVKFTLGGDLRGRKVKVKVASMTNKFRSGISPFTNYNVKVK